MRWLSLIYLLVLSGCSTAESESSLFTAAEQRAIMAREWALDSMPIDNTNAYAQDAAAQAFGALLFNEPGLSSNGSVACTTCHDPELGFSDGQSFSEGLGRTRRHAPHLFNVGFQRWFYWDGRVDTLWGQALSPIEDDLEMGHDRLSVVRFIAEHPEYGPQYQSIFGAMPAQIAGIDVESAKPMPNNETDPRHRAWLALSDDEQAAVNQVFVNLGKAIAAYEMTLIAGRSPFDDFAESLRLGNTTEGQGLSDSALRGLKLFMSTANCHLCHTGTLFSDREFHNLGFTTDDIGRTNGVLLAQAAEFSSASEYSDDPEGAKSIHLNALISGHITDGAFKTPSLRNVALSPPYMHDGRFATLREVVQFYNDMPAQVGPGDRELFLIPLGLDEQAIDDLVSFLESLTAY